MCGRYQFSREIDTPAMRRLRYLAADVGLPDGDIAPGADVPVLIDGGAKARLTWMRWGFPVGTTVVVNARLETAAQKPSFAQSLRQRRCAIPTTGFYEWSRSGARQQYHFTGQSGELLWLAGLYDVFDDIPRFAVLTRPAEGQVAAIHHRQPVTLTQGELLRWLRDGTTPVGTALRGAPIDT